MLFDVSWEDVALCWWAEVFVIANDCLGEYDKITAVVGFDEWSQAGTLNRLLDEEVFNCSSKWISGVRVYLCVKY